MLSNLYCTKAVFGCGFGWQPTPLVGLLAFGGKSHSQKPNQIHPQAMYTQRASVATWIIDRVIRYRQLEHGAIDGNTRKLVLHIPVIHLAILGMVHGASS